VTDTDDPVARAGESQNSCGNRRHAARQTHRALRPLKRRDLLFEGADGRIGGARVDPARALAAKRRGHFRDARESKERGLDDRRHNRIENRVAVMGDDQLRAGDRAIGAGQRDISLISSSVIARIAAVYSRAAAGDRDAIAS